MFSLWRNRSLARVEAKRRAIERLVPLRKRLDPISLSIWGLSVVAIVALGAVLANGQLRFGWFDPSPLRPFADDRLAANLRSDAARANGPFVAASYLAGNDQLSVLRQKGALHSVDLRTGLWSDDDGLSDIAGIGSDFVDLSQACPTRLEGALSHCPDKTGLFAYSDAGGLVLRNKGNWRTILSDSRFVGASGKPVEEADVTGIAVSEDKRWLLMATKADGLGLFDLTQRKWIAIPVADQQAILADEHLKAPARMAAVGPVFLLGLEKGLMTLTFDAEGQLDSKKLVGEEIGAILDLAVHQDEALILAKRPCSGGACLALYRFAQEGGLERLFGETELYPQLSQAQLSRALVSQDGKRIMMLGEAGIYLYDRVLRNWKQLLADPVGPYLEAPSVDGIYFAAPGKVGLLERSGQIRFWSLDGQMVRSLALDGTGALLVQSQSNQTWRIVGDEASLLNDGLAAREPLAKMKRSVAAFDRLVMVGEDFLVLHDLKKRSYVSISRAELSPSLLFQPDSRLFGGADILWALSGDQIEAWRLAGSEAQPILDRVAHRLLPSRLKTIHRDGNDLLVVDAKGQPFRVALAVRTIELQPMLGEDSGESGPVRDVVSLGDRTYLARDRSVSVYSLAERGYVDKLSMPVNEDIRQIASVDGALYMLGSGGSLIAEGHKQRLTGSDEAFGFGAHQISDAQSNGAELFLASARGITVYSPARRSIVRTIKLSTAGPLHLAGLSGSVPVSYDGKNAWLGKKSLAVGRARVLSASMVGDEVASVQNDGEVTFLARHTIVNGKAGKPTCYYRNPGPAGDAIIDVASVPGAGVVALVGGDLWLRDQAHRRFSGFRLSRKSLPRNARMSLIGSHLVVHNEQDAWIVALDQLKISDSCSRASVDLSRKIEHLTAGQLAVSRTRREIGLLQDDGSYQIWKNGTLSSLMLPRGSQLPVPKDFRSVARLGGSLYFSDDRALWRYDSAKRHWSRLAFASDGQAFAHTDVWARGEELVLTLEDKRGRSFGGVADPELKALSLSPLMQWHAAALPFSPDRIRDVALMPDSNWLFLGENALAVADAPNHKPDNKVAGMSAAIALPFSPDGRHIRQQNGQMVILDGGSVEHPASLLIIKPAGTSAANGWMPEHFSYRPARGEQVTVLGNNQLLRRSADGAVSLCQWVSGQADFDHCDPLLPPALRFDGEDIAVAYQIDGSQWLVQNRDGAVFLIDRATRKQQQLGTDLERIEAVVIDGKALLLRVGEDALYALDLVSHDLERRDGADALAAFRAGASLAEQTDILKNALSPQSGELDGTGIDQQNGQIVLSAGGYEVARLDGQLTGTDAPAAKSGGFGWDRKTGQFSFSDENGNAFYLPARDAMPEGRFAFAAPGKSVMLDAARYMVTNRHGAWIYQTGKEPSLRWKRMNLPEDVSAVGHGRVYFADGRAIGVDNPSPLVANTGYRIDLGALQIKGQVGGAGLSAQWSDGLRIYNAFSRDGFLFDDRRDIAFSDGESWFLTPVGLVGTHDLSRSASLPAAGTSVLTSADDRLYALEGKRQWLVFDAMGWQRADNPFTDRQIATDQDLIWLYQDGRLITRSTTRNMSAERRLGLRFESDILFDAAYSEQGLVMRLGDGVRQFSGFDALSASLAATANMPSGQTLAVRPMRDGTRAIVALTRRGAIARKWDGQSFVRVGYEENPDIERLAAGLDWLRVRFVASKPSVELKTELAGFEAGWSPISWEKGEPMPMDRFLAIHGHGGRLYAGTSVGLQILQLQQGQITAQRFVELGNSLSSPSDHVPVLHVGTYYGRPASVYAAGSGACLAIEQDMLLPCEVGIDLGREDLGGNDFWRWERDKGRIMVRYFDEKGQLLGEAIALPASGRFPHDELDALVRCNGVLAQSWHGNLSQLSRQGNGLKLSRTARFGNEGKVTLSCQEKTVASSYEEPLGLPAGLYVEAGRIWRWEEGELVASDEFGAALKARQGDRRPYEAQQMRVRNEQAGVLFEYRDDMRWKRLDFAGGRLAIDEREGLVSAQGMIWAYSPQGFVPLVGDDAEIDPDLFSLQKLDRAEGEPVCRFDRAATANDGSSLLALAREEGDSPLTLMRCMDGRLWQGHLDARAIDARLTLRKGRDDPFVKQSIVGNADTGIWLIGRTAGREGSLQFRWHGEENGLAAGRFALDDIRQIARIEPSHIDLMTAIGWVRQPDNQWESENGARAINQEGLAGKVLSFGPDADVDRVLDRDRADMASLCLSMMDGRFYRWQANGQMDQVEACDVLLAEDGRFAYRKGKNGLHMSAASLNGSKISRHLVDGQFSDLVARGHAVLSRWQGGDVVAISGEKRVNLFDLETLDWLGAWAVTRDPEGLFLDENGDIGILAENRQSDLRGQQMSLCKGLDGLGTRLSGLGAAKMPGLEITPKRAYADLVGSGGRRARISLDCDSLEMVEAGDVAELTDRARYLSHFELWGRPPSRLSLQFLPDGSLSAQVGDIKAALATLPEAPILVRQLGNRFVILTSEEIYEADLDALLSFTMTQGGRHD
nr:hypothetical protein [uncultured Cohaesibacter sp.]